MKNWNVYRKLGVLYGVIWAFLYTKLDASMKVYGTFPMYLLFILSSMKVIRDPNSTEKEKSGNKKFVIFLIISMVLSVIRLIIG